MKTSKQINKITIERLLDEYSDLSWLGEFSDKPKNDFAIEHDPNNHRTYNYFNSCNAESKEQAEQDYKLMMEYENGSRYLIGIQAKAEIQLGNQTQTIKSYTLWGIDSEEAESYIREIELEQIKDLTEQLMLLGFSFDEIEKHLKERV